MPQLYTLPAVYARTNPIHVMLAPSSGATEQTSLPLIPAAGGFPLSGGTVPELEQQYDQTELLAAGRAFDLAIMEDAYLPLEEMLAENQEAPGWVLADEQLLAQEWLTPKEDEAWRGL